MSIWNGIDCTAQITEKIAEKLVGGGYKFVCRYLVPISMASKRLTETESEVMTKYGLKILSIYESTADRVKGGAEAGKEDGIKAFKEAITVRMPKGKTTIYFAVDYDAQAKDFDTIEEYFRSAKAEIPGYKIGCYGSYYVIEEMKKRGVCDSYWQTYAWSNGRKSTHANVYQYKNGANVYGFPNDLNVSMGEPEDAGFWNYNTREALTFDKILLKVSTNAADWIRGIHAAVSAASAAGDLGALEVLKYFPSMLEKVWQLDYEGTLNYEQILYKATNSPASWIEAINLSSELGANKANMGALKVFKYAPQLIEKVYEGKA